MSRVLVVATSRKTRGGITSVIKAHEMGDQWKKYHCVWIQTHRDGSLWRKVWYFGTAILKYIILLPFCDIVHFHFSEKTSVKRKCLLMPIAKMMGKKTIAHFHSFSLETTIRGGYREKYKYLFLAADVSIVLSEYWRKALVDELKIPAKKVKVLYNPCPIIKTRDEMLQHNLKRKTILYAGTVCHRKGYDDLIRAFAKIAKKYPDWNVVLAGNGEVEKGRAISKELGIANQVEFLGWVSGEQKDKAFRESMIFCLPSYAEGFPMAVLDAWAYGLPVITTPVGGIPDVAKDGENMLLFNPGDIDALAHQLEKMIFDENLRNRIALASLDFAENKFNQYTINKQLGELYEDLSKKYTK